MLAGMAVIGLACGCRTGGARSTPDATSTVEVSATSEPTSTVEPTASAEPNARPIVTATPECESSNAVPEASSGDVVVNADGDGVPDRMRIYPIASSPDEKYGLELVLDGRSVVRVPLPFQNVAVAPIGSYDVNGDGHDELFVNTGRGAYAYYVDLYELDFATCSLVRLAGPPWHTASAPAPPITPPQFCVGASVGNGCGLVCSGGLLISTVFSRTSDDPLRYSANVTSYAIDGDHLRTVSMTVEDLGPGEGVAFDCGGLRLPGYP
jgi:hypothetical protein